MSSHRYFFAMDVINDIAALPKNQAGSRYCFNCTSEQPHVSAHHNVRGHSGQWHRFELAFVGTRICATCGFTRGKNPGVKNKALKAQVFAADNYECVYCAATTTLTADHIIPFTHGGDATFENLLTACQRCNTRRGMGIAPPTRFGRYR